MVDSGVAVAEVARICVRVPPVLLATSAFDTQALVHCSTVFHATSQPGSSTYSDSHTSRSGRRCRGSVAEAPSRA